jgi:hypothetical protein
MGLDVEEELNAEIMYAELNLMPKSRMSNSQMPNWTERRNFEYQILNAEFLKAVLC